MKRKCRDFPKATKLRFCVPIEVFKGSADISLTLNKLGILGEKETPFELIVTGVSDEDKKLVTALENKEIKKAFNFPKNLFISVVVRPIHNNSVFSLSSILNDWFNSMQDTTLSGIRITLPTPISVIQNIDDAMRQVWKILSDA